MNVIGKLCERVRTRRHREAAGSGKRAHRAQRRAQARAEYRKYRDGGTGGPGAPDGNLGGGG